MPSPAPGASTKQQLRFLHRVRPQIAACVAKLDDSPPTIDIVVTLVLDPTTGAAVESANAGLSAAGPCAHDAMLAIDPSTLALPRAPERWTIHASLYTGVR